MTLRGIETPAKMHKYHFKESENQNADRSALCEANELMAFVKSAFFREKERGGERDRII